MFQAAFRFLGFNEEKQVNVFRVLAAILHLGNLNFTKHGREEEVVIQDEECMIPFFIYSFIYFNLFSISDEFHCQFVGR